MIPTRRYRELGHAHRARMNCHVGQNSTDLGTFQTNTFTLRRIACFQFRDASKLFSDSFVALSFSQYFFMMR